MIAIYVSQVTAGVNDVADELFEVLDFCEEKALELAELRYLCLQHQDFGTFGAPET